MVSGGERRSGRRVSRKEGVVIFDAEEEKRIEFVLPHNLVPWIALCTCWYPNAQNPCAGTGRLVWVLAGSYPSLGVRTTTCPSCTFDTFSIQLSSAAAISLRLLSLAVEQCD